MDSGGYASPSIAQRGVIKCSSCLGHPFGSRHLECPARTPSEREDVSKIRSEYAVGQVPASRERTARNVIGANDALVFIEGKQQRGDAMSHGEAA